jgi:hypothetical protein
MIFFGALPDDEHDVAELYWRIIYDRDAELRITKFQDKASRNCLHIQVHHFLP